MPEKNGQQMDAEQKLRYWMGRIPGYTKELFTPERFPHFLDVMLQYSRYGFDNAVLIAAQCREKELALADRGMWEKKYGRNVTDGGEGIQVIVPVKTRKKELRENNRPETKKPVPELDVKMEMGQAGAAAPRLHVHTVYNVSQTEGRPLPERPVFEMAADADNFGIFIKAIAALSPVPVNFAEFGSGKQEYSYNADGEIVIQKGMDMTRTMQTAARTVARALIDELGQMMEPSAPQDQKTIGIETESVAYMCCRYFEMDASGWHFEDVAGWHDNMDFAALRSSMDMVRKTAVIFNECMLDSMRQEMMRETWKELDRKQVYRYTAGYAGENGEMDACHASRKENIACREAIEKAIRENFDGMHLKQEAVEPVMEAYGAERVAYVLASTVKYMEHDGRFSGSNKLWAHTIQGLRDDDGQSRDAGCDIAVASHPGVLDLFINLAREYISGLEEAEIGKDGVEMETDDLGRISAAMQENQKLPPVSDMRGPEAALGNFSRAEIEETVFSYAQAALEDAGLDQKVEILGVRVYGSRSRDGIYTEKSDLDVVVSYSGEVREDAFFNMLHAEKFQIAGLDVDISPISTEKTGTLEDYLEQADKYLDIKEAEMQASGQNAPGREEQAETVSFFVAECTGHPVAGRYREGLTLPEAAELYQKISADKADSVPGIGLRLEGGGVHDGDYMLMADGRIQKDDIMQNTYLKDNPLVQKALEDLETAFPDRHGQAAAQAQKKLEKEPEKPHRQEDKDVDVPSGTDAGTSGKPEKGQPAGRKESILKTLRERQAGIKGQEKGQTKQKMQTQKKGEVEL